MKAVTKLEKQNHEHVCIGHKCGQYIAIDVNIKEVLIVYMTTTKDENKNTLNTFLQQIYPLTKNE